MAKLGRKALKQRSDRFEASQGKAQARKRKGKR
jgi:hypothetical protein